jgi:MFS transporter, DHA1 family, staphyloferrin B biosynthesis exporter
MTRRADRVNLVLLWAGQFVNTAGLMMLVPIMPFYIRGMGISGTAEIQTWAGVAIAAPALALTVATPLWGRLGDRVGRKWMVVRALAGLAAAMVVMAASGDPLVLVLGRLLQGCLGGVVEAAAAFAGAAGPAGRRGASLGKSFSATAAGSLVGPLAGGALVTAGGLRGLMLVIAGLAAVFAVACAFALREPHPQGRPTVGTRSTQARHRPRLREHVPSALTLGVAAIAAYFGVYGLIPVFAEQVQTTVDDSGASLWVGVLQSVTWGSTLLASFWWGQHNDRAGRPVRSFALSAGGCALGIAAQALPLSPAALIPLRLVQGFCFAALAQSLFLHVSRFAPRERTSGFVGAANSFLLTGQSAGPLLAGPLAVLLPVPATIVVMGTACGVAGVLAGIAARAETRSEPSEDDRERDREDDTEELHFDWFKTSDREATIELDLRAIHAYESRRRFAHRSR